MIEIYTDGACEPNPGPGGWGAIFLYTDGHCGPPEIKMPNEISGLELNSTNNRMEITAVLESMRAIKKPDHLHIYSDSSYVVNSIGSWSNGKPTKRGWIIKWEELGWKRRGTRKTGPLKNIDLWQQILKETRRHLTVKMTWIKGHNGNIYNERADTIAESERKLAKSILEDRKPK